MQVEAGNHFVWEFLPGHGAINVHPSAAILHHYRVCEFGGDDCVKSAHVVDRTAHRYKDRLAAQVSKRWALLKDDCGLGDLFVPPLTPPAAAEQDDDGTPPPALAPASSPQPEAMAVPPAAPATDAEPGRQPEAKMS